MKKQFALFSALVLLALLASMILPAGSARAAGAGIAQDFRGTAATGWDIRGSATLTAPSIDSDGNGWLRLTGASNSEAGSAIYTTAFDNDEGIQVSFMYATYGGTGADGFTFYLIDGATGTPTVGASGGGLGYSWNGEDAKDGVTNGYVGIGFDEYGNFLNNTSNYYGTGGLGAGRQANRIGIRGPGTLRVAGGFPYLASSDITTIGTGNRAGAKHVVITITPSPTQKISVTVDDVAQITNYDMSGHLMPAKFKMGFSASTGTINNNHEIRDLTVSGITSSTTTVGTSGTPSILGASVTFTATVTGATTPTGSVAFYNGTTYLGTGALVAGVATYATSALPLGNLTITAKYLGDSTYATSQGTVAQEVIACQLPVVSSVTANAGPTTGNTVVSITGDHFKDTGCTVTSAAFGGAGFNGTSFTVVDTTHITVTTPAHVMGPVDVTVTGTGGTGTLTGGFTFVPPPTITDIAPSFGPVAGGTIVTVTGTYLTGLGTGNGVFTFPGANCVVNSATQATCTTTTTTHPAGPVGVSVTTAGGTGNSPTDFTFVPPPTVEGGYFTTGVARRVGPVVGGTEVTVYGKYLTGLGSGNATFTFGGVEAVCDNFAVAGTSADCTTPNGKTTNAAFPDSGHVFVVATTPVGGIGTVKGDFYYVAISPQSGPVGGGQTVKITGVGYLGSIKATRRDIMFDPSRIPSSCEFTDTLATCVTPTSTAGLVDVGIQFKNDSITVALEDDYGYTFVAAPAFNCCGGGISPKTGSALGGTEVTIYGRNLSGGTFTFGGELAACTVNTEGTQAVCTTPAHTAGLVDVVVTTIGGTATIPNGFEYIPVLIDSISPSTGPVAGGTDVIITGAHFTGAYFTFDGITAVCTVVDTDTKVSCKSPAHALGPVDVVVVSAGGVKSLPVVGGFTYVKPLPDGWIGSTVIESDKLIATVGRPHMGTPAQISSYDGFGTGTLTAYLPMLFKNAFGGTYNSVFYVQNVDDEDTAGVTIKYINDDGSAACTILDSITKLTAKGYTTASLDCLGTSWVGSVVVTSDLPIVAVGRPHIGDEVMAYNSFSAGSKTVMVPMLFNQVWGIYDAALYVQNVSTAPADITIKFYDKLGALTCTMSPTSASFPTASLPALATKGYWLPTSTCTPAGWAGGAMITSTQDIVALGRPHVGSQITTYSGFTDSNLTAYVPMLFKQAFSSSYDSALYVQNTSDTAADISIKFYDSAGTLSCTKNATLAPWAAMGYWLPTDGCMVDGWAGGALITSTQDVVAVARPHIAIDGVTEVTAYPAVYQGALKAYLPMLFKTAYGSYESALYVQNVEDTAANINIKFFDSVGAVSCVINETLPAFGFKGYWLPNVCNP